MENYLKTNIIKQRLFVYEIRLKIENKKRRAIELSQNNIDFGYFIGQIVTHIDTDTNVFLRLIFEEGRLSAECPWRLRKKKEILVGETDCISAPEKYSRLHLNRLLKNKKILSISYYEELVLLTIEFEGDLFFDLFHNSSYFEGWTLQGNNGLEVFTLPGGEVCY